MPKIELDENVKSQIIEDWGRGDSIETISRRYKTHTIKVANAVKERFGGVLPKRKRKCRVFTQSEELEMIEMYKSGKHSAKEIYTRFKTSDDNFLEVLKKHGIDYVPLNFCKINEETEGQIIDMYQNQKISSIKICKILNIPYQRIRKTLLKHKLLDGKSNKAKDKYPQSLVEEILNEYKNEQVSVMDVSKKYGLSYPRIRNILLKNNVAIRTRKSVIRAPIPLKINRDSDIIKHFLENGRIAKHTATVLGISQNTVIRVLKAANLYVSKRYSYNENYFSNIDSHEKAYILVS